MRRADLEVLFGLGKSQFSEITWESIQQLTVVRVALVVRNVQKEFLGSRYEDYAIAVERKSHFLISVVSFIDGTNLTIALPSGQGIDQPITCNKYKRKHTITSQAVTTSCGLTMHPAGLTQRQ